MQLCTPDPPVSSEPRLCERKKKEKREPFCCKLHKTLCLRSATRTRVGEWAFRQINPNVFPLAPALSLFLSCIATCSIFFSFRLSFCHRVLLFFSLFLLHVFLLSQLFRFNSIYAKWEDSIEGIWQKVERLVCEHDSLYNMPLKTFDLPYTYSYVTYYTTLRRRC